MEKNPAYKKILDRIKTEHEQELMLAEIETLEKSMYEEKGAGFENALKYKVRSWAATAITESIEKNQIERAAFLKNLKALIQAREKADLTLAFEPTEPAIEAIYFAIKETFKGDFYLKIIYNPAIFGGLILNYKGIHKDLSLLPVFKKIIKAKKDEIRQLLDE